MVVNSLNKFFDFIILFYLMINFYCFINEFYGIFRLVFIVWGVKRNNKSVFDDDNCK